MRIIRAFLLRLGGLFHKGRRDALMKFGAVESAREAYRDRRGLPLLDSLAQDLRYGARMLLKNPAFSITAIGILAIGIGANTAIFSVVYAVILRPLPFAESGRLAMIKVDWPAQGVPDIGATMPDFLEWRNRNRVFDRLEAFSTESDDISGDGDPERVTGAEVSAELFPFLGVAPAQGRRFLVEEQEFGKHRVVILSAALWRRRFGDQAKPGGQTIKINGELFTIVGVMPQGFDFPERGTELWRPLSIPAGHQNNTRSQNWLGVIARLKQGVTIDQAQADIDNIHRQLAQEFKPTFEVRERVLSLSEHVVGKELTTILLVLFGAVGFVLLIACANTANLMLARAVSRRKEMAIRATLGAHRGRIIRQALTESLLTGVSGGILGLFVATLGINALLRLAPDLPRFADVKVNGGVLLFTLALSLLTSLLAGLAPAWHATKMDLQTALKDSARTASGSAGARRARSALIISEIALSLVLLICAGLMINSLLRLQGVDPGYRTDHILSTRISLPPMWYPPDRGTKIADFFKQLDERVRAIPGVQTAGYTSCLPLTRRGWVQYITLEGRIHKTLEETPMIHYRQISPRYFETLGIRLLKGRALDERDTRNTEPVAVVNESFVKLYYPDEDPIGKRFYGGEPEDLTPPHAPFTRWTIVGVSRDIKHEGLGSEARPEIFTLQEQSLAKRDVGPDQEMFFVVRATGDPAALAAAVRSEVQALDKDLPVTEVVTMDRLRGDSLRERRLITLLLFIFSIIALALASAGVYGVMSYSVTQRAHEIGIRMALGAQRIDTLKLIVGQGMKLAFIGVIIGLLGSAVLTRFIETLLFGVKAGDPLTYASIVSLIVFVSALACYLPAQRAMKVDPMIVLKRE